MNEIPDPWDRPDALHYPPNLLLVYQRIAIQKLPLKFCFLSMGWMSFKRRAAATRTC